MLSESKKINRSGEAGGKLARTPRIQEPLKAPEPLFCTTNDPALHHKMEERDDITKPKQGLLIKPLLSSAPRSNHRQRRAHIVDIRKQTINIRG